LIGGEDHGPLAGHQMRLGDDLTLAIEEQHPHQIAGGNRFAEAVGYVCH